MHNQETVNLLAKNSQDLDPNAKACNSQQILHELSEQIGAQEQDNQFSFFD